MRKIQKLIVYLLILTLFTPLFPMHAAELRGEPSEEDIENETQIPLDEEDNVVRDNFDIKLEVGTQSVWNNSVPIIIHLTTNIDLDRVEIRASTPAALDFEYLGKQYFPVKAGETYVLKSRVFPKRQGSYRLSVNAIAWQYETNFSSSSTIDLQINDDLLLIPQTTQYRINIVLKYLLYIVLIGGLGVGAFFAGKKGHAKLKVWLLPED